MNKMTAAQQQMAAANLAAKRQKTGTGTHAGTTTTAAARVAFDANEYFPGLPRIEYRPDAGPEDTLCYRYYNPAERVNGRCMEDWLRPALSFWDALRATGADAFGQPTFQRPWDDGTHSLDNYQRRIRAAFELCAKLGIKMWAAWDRDLAPEGETLEETQRNLDESVDLCLELQQRTGIRPLWVGADLHSHPRYCQGAGTAPDASVVAMAGAQVRRALQAAQRLSAECFLFWGGRDGYSSPLNTDPGRELRGYARLLRMTAEYRDRLGYRGQLLLETTPRLADAPACGLGGHGGHHHGGHGHGAQQHGRTAADDQHRGAFTSPQHRYDDCAAASVCLLKQYGLDRHYKLSAPPGHQIVMSSAYGMLGCVNATCLDFPPEPRQATLLMKTVIEQGGMQPGGLLLGVPLRRESVDCRDLLEAYVAVIDSYAKALRTATRIVADGVFSRNLQQRYLSFHSGFGGRLSSGEATLEDCEEHARKQAATSAALLPGQGGQGGQVGQDWNNGRPEHWEAVYARYLDQDRDRSRE